MSKLPTDICRLCKHPRSEHGKERDLLLGVDSKRELCLLCPSYVVWLVDGSEVSGYPNGKAWHRFREMEAVCL